MEAKRWHGVPAERREPVVAESTIFEHIFEESPLPVAIYDPRGAPRRRNDAHASFVSALGNATGLGDFNVLTDPRSVRFGHAAHFERAYAGITLDYRFSCVRGEGAGESALHFVHLLMPVLLADASVGSVVGIIADVTEQEETAQEHMRFQQRLFQLQKLESLGLLAGGIAHDFNNLLVAVLGNASYLLRKIDADSPLRARVLDIETAARRAADIAHQMLLYAGKGSAEFRELDAVELVQEISELLRVSVSKRGELRLDCEPDVPLVRGDGTQLRQVVMNLITNASEALGERGGEIRVRTRCVEPTPEYLGRCLGKPDLTARCFVAIEVQDDGCGMTPEVISRAFDPFFTTKFTGRGLGLSAVLGILRRHRAALNVESVEGAGTTMTVLIPSARAATARASQGLEASPPCVQRGLQVLVVDDEPSVRAVTRGLLEEIGCVVELAESSHAALEICSRRESELALVLMDVTMPGLDGNATRELLQARHPHLPVLLMSGFGPPAAIPDEAFLSKPFTLDDLRAAVARALSRGTQAQAI